MFWQTVRNHVGSLSGPLRSWFKVIAVLAFILVALPWHAHFGLLPRFILAGIVLLIYGTTDGVWLKRLAVLVIAFVIVQMAAAAFFPDLYRAAGWYGFRFQRHAAHAMDAYDFDAPRPAKAAWSRPARTHMDPGPPRRTFEVPMKGLDVPTDPVSVAEDYRSVVRGGEHYHLCGNPGQVLVSVNDGPWQPYESVDLSHATGKFRFLGDKNEKVMFKVY